MAGLNAQNNPLVIKARLEMLSLRRTAFSSGVSIISTAVMLFVAWRDGAPHFEIVTTAGLNILLNLLRLAYGAAILMWKNPPVSRGWVRTFRFVSHLINATWLALAFSIYQSLGVHADSSMFCMLVTTAMIASAQPAFATMLDVALGTMLGLGLGTAVFVLAFGTSITDYAIGALAPVFACFIAYNTYEFYAVLVSNEHQLDSQGQKNALMKSLLNATPGFMTLLDEECRYVMVNEAFERALGRDIIGHKLGYRNEERDFSQIVEDFIATSDHRKMVEIKLGPPDRKEHYLVSLAKINGDQKLIAVQSLNIEEQKKVQFELSKARSDAEHAGRLAALGEMISSVAHEIRNPLTVISGRALFMLKAVAKAPLTAEQVSVESQKITSMVERITKIIQTVLKFSRGEGHGEFAKASVKDLVEEAIFLTEIKCKTSSVEFLRTEIDATLMINCQALQLSQVLVNLVNNAVDALEGKSAKWVKIEIRALAGDRVEFRVMDSGLGIPPEIRARLLEPFFTTKPAGKGTGLGLSISRGIIEKHQGKLWIDADAPNTTFVFDLPVELAVPEGATKAS